VHHSRSHESLILLVGQIRTNADRQRHLLLSHHRLKLGMLGWIELAKRIQRNTVGDAVMQPKHHTETSRKWVHQADITRGDGTTAEIRSHHQLFTGLCAHHVVSQKHLAAKIDGFA
jgi:hypothetical protein